MPVWQKALETFQKALNDKKFLENNRLPLISAETSNEVFEQMTDLLYKLGIPVILKDDLGEEFDFYERPFHPSGVVEAEFLANGKISKPKILIARPKRNARIICHEFAHIVDYALHGRRCDRQDELIASAAGYLFVCEIISAVVSPNQDARYAKSQGAIPQDSLWEKEYIINTFQKMISLFHGETTSPSS